MGTWMENLWFEVASDHEPLVALYKSHSRSLPVTVAQHISKLGGFDFKVIYEPGSTKPSDYVSRRPPPDRSSSAQEMAVAGVEDVEE